jgi:hypothetical protein
MVAIGGRFFFPTFPQRTACSITASADILCILGSLKNEAGWENELDFWRQIHG